MTEEEDRVGLELIDPASLRITWANDYHRQLPGFADRQVVGNRLDDFMPMADELGIDEKLRRVAETGVPHRERMQRLAGPGRDAYAWWWSVHLLPSGELLVAYALEGRPRDG